MMRKRKKIREMQEETEKVMDEIRLPEYRRMQEIKQLLTISANGWTKT